MISIGIDQSLASTGIVVLENNEIKYFEIINTNKGEDVDNFDRVSRIANKIINICNKYQPEYIALEGLSFASRGDVTRTLAGLQWHTVILLRQANYGPKIIPPKTLKKLATGSGNAKKQEMINSVPANYLEEFKNAGYSREKVLGDLSDAYHLACCHQ